MNSITSATSPIVQQQIANSTSFAKDLFNSTASVSNPSQFASDFMNTIQKASSISTPTSISPTSISPASISGLKSSSSNKLSGSDKIANSVSELIDAVDQKQKDADSEVKKVLTGESDNIHQAVIKMQEAGVAFSLMIEVRNQLITSYQELMRTSV